MPATTDLHLTTEPEITGPVDLCRDDGRTLDPAAQGWSRVPLHRANLAGRWGRTKRWDYWGVLTPTHALSVTYADVDYLGIADVWWADLRTGRTGGRNVVVPGARGLDLPDRPATEPLRFHSSRLDLDLTDHPGGTRLVAAWTEADGTPASLEVDVDLPTGHESLNVVIPWSEQTFQYTSKHQARPARGVLRVGEHRVAVGGDGADAAWGVLDVGRGRWPYRTNWNWGGGTGVAADGSVVGLQFGGRWTEGTGFTENGLVVDGRLHKLGQELVWTYSWDQPMKSWTVRSPDGRVDLRLVPRLDKHTRIEALVMGMEVHQVFGTWSGTVTTDDGTVLDLPRAIGFAEESRSRW
jgi:hypothetical protein